MRSPVLRGTAAYFLAMLVVVATWAIGVPRFASPDEPAHVYKAYATAHGHLLGKAAPGFPNNLREFDGPASIGPPNLGCYVGQPDVPAGCDTEISPRLISSAARYPPWYYGLVGLPVVATGQSERIVAYRLVSAVLCVGLLALAMLLTKRSRRSDLSVLQVAAVTPMALFLMASVNPNAIEIAVFVAIWACLARVATDSDVPHGVLILGSFLAAAVVLMRPISIVWLAGMVAVVLIAMSAARRRQLYTWRTLAWVTGPTAGALVISWIWAVYAKIEVKDDRLTNTLSLGAALRRSVDNWPGYFRQTIGVLGWLDTVMPSFVYAIWIVVLVAIAVVHLRGASARRVMAFAALIVVWLALPLLINGFTNARAGLTYQGRYSLPIFVGVAFLPLWNERPSLRRSQVLQRGLVIAVVALVIVAEVGALWQTLRRFTVGAHGKIVLTEPLPWEPSITPMALIAINAVAMLGLSWLALRSWGQVEAAAGEGHGEGAEHGTD
ncbi:MAG: DUF2142 domain-containing protein [Ilumatobacteraceae bacterium]